MLAFIQMSTYNTIYPFFSSNAFPNAIDMTALTMNCSTSQTKTKTTKLCQPLTNFLIPHHLIHNLTIPYYNPLFILNNFNNALLNSNPVRRKEQLPSKPAFLPKLFNNPVSPRASRALPSTTASNHQSILQSRPPSINPPATLPIPPLSQLALSPSPLVHRRP